MIGCLRTRVRKQPIIALYFVSENEHMFYNLEAWLGVWRYIEFNIKGLQRCFMIKFYIPHSENLYTFQNTIYYIKLF